MSAAEICQGLFHTAPELRGQIDPEKLADLDIDQGLKVIQDANVQPLLDYLLEGEFRRTNVTFMNGYMIIVHFGDQQAHSNRLYQFYTETIQGYCKSIVEGIQELRGRPLLEAIAAQWEKITILVYWMQRLFTYLDRYFTRNNNENPDLFQCGLLQFQRTVYDPLKLFVKEATIDEINKERDGESVDRKMLRRIIEMYCTVGDREVKIVKVKTATEEQLLWQSTQKGLYKTDFEESFLEASGHYYERASTLWLSQMTCPEFLRETDKRLHDEEDRLNTYLDKSTGDPLRKKCQKELIAKRATLLTEMDTGALHMFENKQLDNLSLMFVLFKKEPETLENITAVMKPYMMSRVDAIVSDKQKQDNPDDYVEGLLDLKTELDGMVQRCFPSESIFEKARNTALEEVLNRDSRCAKFLALFCDQQLRKGLKGKTDSDVTSFVARVVSLFLHLKDKDIFLECYKERLSKRLLQKQSVSKDAEDNMINRLRVEVGQQSVQKILAMFKDMEVSEKLQEDFGRSDWVNHLPDRGLLEVKVLQSNSWPVQMESGIKPGPTLESVMEVYNKFYTKSFNGRKLQWMLNMGTAEVSGSQSCFPKGPSTGYIFVVSTFQAMLLLLFNTSPTLPVEQLIRETGIPEAEGKRQLISMASGSQKILKKDTPGKDADMTTNFSINTEFQSAMGKKRVNVALIKKEDPARDTKPGASSEVHMERKHVIDAIVVRIMKSRKQLQHNALLDEVFRQCQLFKPQPSAIKAQIEHLIDREFLRRDPDNRNMYIYMP
uniref:Cullin family profile domain-containing protein n=1 Tax=Chromera velia CCMP2878 TaxID=1169474 RepID=A0A0G4IB85_9ALVE|mmetsp:Transcript_18827/g.38039  ORF Transcript_18827/g.38039 Transcript_18827/m.38039 type:complete len:775 (+) Transcript_18827:217-2541(+)|eukprot:Cvel_12689.t1-p1 / transcript=Cvel_12689.t1 / gene=Cvel_12689 / organism=Chromera_velia_CCMP2878 / gene_product=Cullin-3, putative / transcript_product=Cullin-3, putative / location=Cvel_scaffold839:43406-52823(+) / protein_length=774 / sequence_SO=supercontig / SO=protein_coding / is_pseudo=false